MRFDEVKQPLIDMLRAPAVTTRSGFPWRARLLTMTYCAVVTGLLQTVREATSRQQLSESQRAALLRILVAGSIFGAADVWRAPLLAHADPDIAAVLRVVVLVSAFTTMIGAFTRVSSFVLAVSTTGLLGLLQSQGTPIHVHHLAWLAIIVASARCGDAWSVDARVRRIQTPATDSAPSATRWTCVVLGLVYFFPGLHKLLDETSPFTDGDALARLVRLKAIEAGNHDAAVLLGLDTWPNALLVGGALIIAAQLTVVATAFFAPRFGFALIVFIHVSIAFVLRMPYSVLAVFAVAFLLPPRSGWRGALASLTSSRVVCAAGTVLVLGITWAGLRGDIAGYPFACYPTFALPVPDRIRVIDVFVGDPRRPLRHDVVVPADLRTPATFAARRIQTQRDAEAFISWRMRDRRFAAAVGDANSVDVEIGWRDLSELGAPRRGTPYVFSVRLPPTADKAARTERKPAR